MTVTDQAQLPNTPVNTPLGTDGHETLDAVCRRLMEALGVDHASLMIFQQGTTTGMIVAEYPTFALRGEEVPIPPQVYEMLHTTKRPFALNRVEDAERFGFDLAELERQGLRSMAFIPLWDGETLIGALGLDVYYAYHEFTEAQLSTAFDLAAQVGATVRNMLVFDDLRKRTAQLEFVAHLSRRITSTFDRVAILRALREETLKAIQADLVAVGLVRPEGSMLELYVIGADGTTLTEFTAGSVGLISVSAGGRPVVEANIAAVQHLDYQLLAAGGIRAAAIVPLVAAGQAIGVLILGHHEPGRFGTLDLDFVQEIGNYLAIALENARLYSAAARRADLESLANRLGSLLQEYTDLPGLLLNTTRQLGDALHARRARVRIHIAPSGTGMLAAPPRPTDEEGQQP